MSLILVATPIGNQEDITLRAIKTLKSSDCIVGEELKTLRRRLSSWDIPFKEKTLLTLNEHTHKKKLNELLDYCRHESVCLVSDCGTPSFFDPGYDLVGLCRQENIDVHSLPGVSSLTALMSFLPVKTQRFNVLGFPPQKKDMRKDFFLSYKSHTHKSPTHKSHTHKSHKSQKKDIVPFFLMDAPYRLKKTLFELQEYFPKSQIVLGVNLTCKNELVIQGTVSECLKKTTHLKKENFVVMVYPSGF